MPSITLEQALRLTGELPVLRLKIDAQGVDLQLVRSVPPAYFTRRVETVELEFASDACKDKPLYVGQASASEVSAYLASWGYSKGPTVESSAGCEVRAAHFPRPSVEGLLMRGSLDQGCASGVAHTMPGCRPSAALPCSCSRLLVCVRARTGDTDLSAQGERAWQAVAPPAQRRAAVARGCPPGILWRNPVWLYGRLPSGRQGQLLAGATWKRVGHDGRAREIAVGAMPSSLCWLRALPLRLVQR